MDSLATRPTVAALNRSIETLPAELDDTYDAAMLRIESQPKEEVIIAKRVISWVCRSKHPLNIRELQHALAVELGASRFDEDNILDEDIIVSSCAGLIIMKKNSNIPSLVHYTAEKYFKGPGKNRLLDSELDIVKTCFAYVWLEFHPSIGQEFREYALNSWADHV
jgi:hypothetical protein